MKNEENAIASNIEAAIQKLKKRLNRAYSAAAEASDLEEQIAALEGIQEKHHYVPSPITTRGNSLAARMKRAIERAGGDYTLAELQKAIEADGGAPFSVASFISTHSRMSYLYDLIKKGVRGIPGIYRKKREEK